MAEPPIERKTQPEDVGDGGVCPMCREPLKPAANACVWCGFLLKEEMQRKQATLRRKKILGRPRSTTETIGKDDYAACLVLALIAPVGLAAGRGGVLTGLSALVLLIPMGLGLIALCTAQFRRFLAYLLAGAIGTGLFIILMVAYNFA